MYEVEFPEAILRASFDFDAFVILRCVSCNTLGYSPRVLGDGAYYTYLSQHIPWYYQEQRWEYPIALEMLRANRVRRFLEIGCGAGHFLRLARKHGIDGCGLEIETTSLDALLADGFDVAAGPCAHWSMFDAILMFQVLEHLDSPYDLLARNLSRLCPGGILVLSTPFAPSCASFAGHALLQPPHHGWLPTRRAYDRLAERLGLRLLEARTDPPEPQQIQHWVVNRIGSFRGLGQLVGSCVALAQMLRIDWASAGHTIVILMQRPK